jgi:hypothetical protein
MRTLVNVALTLCAVPPPPAALNGSLANGDCKMDLRVKPDAGSARHGPPLNEHEVRDTCMPGCRPEQAVDRLPECAAPLRRAAAALAGALALLPRAADRPLGAPTMVQVHHDTPRRSTADDGKLNNTRVECVDVRGARSLHQRSFEPRPFQRSHRSSGKWKSLFVSELGIVETRGLSCNKLSRYKRLSQCVCTG